jgi:uroporphyrinogen decarboxylase
LQIERLYHGTDKALFASLPQMNCSFFELGATLFGFETFMENLLLKRGVIEHWLDRLLAHDLEILDKFLTVAGPYLSVIQMSDDFGAQEALMIPPQLYREMFKPRQKKWVEFVKARTDAKVFLHCDGMIEPIIEDFIEAGIDILNPVQTSAKGMGAATLKGRYGKDLCFWGAGVDTQSTLPFGSIKEIADEVKQRIDILSPGGGFVFATIHNIQADIAPRKILAVFNTARTHQRRENPF